jgi:hypothetical protein
MIVTALLHPSVTLDPSLRGSVTPMYHLGSITPMYHLGILSNRDPTIVLSSEGATVHSFRELTILQNNKTKHVVYIIYTHIHSESEVKF